MHIIKKLLILVIVCVTIVIIHNLLKTRAEIKLQAQRELDQRMREGFGESEIESMSKSRSPLSIGPIPDKYLDLPLREFMVKSSYNSAISGEYANAEAIKVVLKKGCRLLDFEIYTVNDNEYVSYSDDFKQMDTINKDNERLTFTDAMSAVSSSAFTNSFCPSPEDPIFILLRIKGNPTKDVYTRIAGVLTTAFPKKLHGDEGKAIQVNGGTRLRDIMGKVVVILDTDGKMSNYDTTCNPSKPSAKSCSGIYDVVNLPANISGGLLVNSYEDILNKPIAPVFSNRDGYGTTINRFMMVKPKNNDPTKTFPKPSDVVNAGLPQFLLYKFYADPDNLEDYENIFNYAKSAFVPISTWISNSPDSQETRKQKSAIPKAPALPLGSAPLLKNIFQ